MPVKNFSNQNNIAVDYALDGGVGRKKKQEDDNGYYGLEGLYSALNAPTMQTYNPTAYSGYQTYGFTPYAGYQTYTPTDFTGYQQYVEKPYEGYSGGDFSYDPFQYDQFSYDYRTDPLYQMYKESYTRKGNQAMQDTLTALSNRTGGVANSYSQAAAQNEYNTYMADLAAKIPELQQIARKMYDTDRNFAYNQYQDDRTTAYNNYLRKYNEDYNNWQNAQNIANANVDLANQYAYANWQAREQAARDNVNLANQYSYANWQAEQAINQANVDLANQYSYANWQMQEAARQAAVEQANKVAMQQWAYQQDAANNNASTKLQQMAIDAQNNAAQNYTDTSVDGLINDAINRYGYSTNLIETLLKDMQSNGAITSREANELREKYGRYSNERAASYLEGRKNSRYVQAD